MGRKQSTTRHRRTAFPDVPAAEFGWWRVLDLPVELLLLATLALSPTYAAQYEEIPGLTFDTLILLAVVVSGVRECFERVRVPALSRALWACAGLIALTHAASFSYSIDRHATLQETLRVTCALALAGMVAREAGRSEAFRARAAVALVLGAAYPAGLGIRQYMVNLGMGESAWRTFGTFASPNSLAGHLVLVLPIALALPAAARQRHTRMVAYVLVALIAGCMPLTASKAGMLAVVAAAGTYALLRVSGPVRKRVGAAVAVAASMVVTVLAVPPVRDRILATFTTQNHSWMFRFYTWKACAQLFADHWLLGTGAGTFSQAYLPYAEVGPTRHAHSCFLEIGGDVGILGLVAFLGFLALGVAAGLRMARSADVSPAGRFRARLGQGIVAALVGSVVHVLFDYDWYIFPTLAALLAIIALSTQPAPPMPETRPVRLRRLGPVVAAAAAALTVFACVSIAGYRAYTQGQTSLQRGSYRTAEASFSHAVRLCPLSGTFWRVLGSSQRYAPDHGRPAFERAIECQPEHHGNHIVFGNVLVGIGALDEAAQHYKRALELCPTATQALIELAAISAEQGRRDEAIGYLERLGTLEESPYGRFPAVPEILNIEFYYAHAGLAELLCARDGTSDGRAGAELSRADAMTQELLTRYDARLARMREHYRGMSGGDLFVRSLLEVYGFTPERIRQVAIMRATVLMLKGHDASASQELVDEARKTEPDTVARILRGDWPGLLVATRQDRLAGGI